MAHLIKLLILIADRRIHVGYCFQHATPVIFLYNAKSWTYNCIITSVILIIYPDQQYWPMKRRMMLSLWFNWFLYQLNQKQFSETGKWDEVLNPEGNGSLGQYRLHYSIDCIKKKYPWSPVSCGLARTKYESYEQCRSCNVQTDTACFSCESGIQNQYE